MRTMTRDAREQEIRELVSRRQPLPFVRAHWLLAELDAARLRLAAAEVELEELRTHAVVLQPASVPLADGEISGPWPEWLTVGEFAKAIGIGKGLAYDLVRRGELTQVRRFGRLVRIHRTALRIPGARRVR